MAIDIKDEAWAFLLQEDVANYMDALHDNLWNEEHGGDPFIQTKTGVPFCGCDTCHYRELLAYAAELIINGYKQGKIDSV